MPETTAPATTQAADDSLMTSIADYAAAIFSEADGTASPDELDAGAEPSEQDETSSDADATDEAGTTPADAADAPTDATPRDARDVPATQRPDGTKPGTEPGTPPDDPLKHAVPLPYTVNGEARQFDSVRVLLSKDGKPQGGFVPPDALPQLQQRLSRADYYEAQNQALYQRVQAFDRLEAKDGQGTVHTGMDAVQHYAVENARLAASVKLLVQTLEDPSAVERLALAQAAGDPSALTFLAERLGVTADKAALGAREHWGRTAATRERETADASAESELRQTSIAQSVEHWGKQFPGLTDADLQRAFTYLARPGSGVFRRATAEEARAAGVKPGQFVVDHPAVYEFLKDRHELQQRHQQGTAKAATTAADAAKENANRLAAARTGKPNGKPAPKSGAKPAQQAQAKPATGGVHEVYDAWRAGKFFSDDE